MKLFISWSGQLSHKIAIELKEWFPLVINQIEPFVSSENITKGNRWVTEIYSELENSNFGIICLTRENLTEPWIMFEAGALSKNISESKVTSILFDKLKQNDIKSPLSLFQNTEFEKEEIRKLINSINNSLGEKRISETMINRSFEKWFPELEEKIKLIQEEYSPTLTIKEENDGILSEILRTTKYISNVVARFNLKIPLDSLDFVKFIEEQPIEYASNGNNHPVRVRVNPIYDSDNVLKELTITKKGINVIPSTGQTGRGVNIEILFYSEQEVFWTLNLNFHKGDTFISTNIIDLSEDEKILLQYETIWRD